MRIFFLFRFRHKLQNTDFALQEWKAAGLNVACGVKAQLATVEEGLVVKIVGRLAAADQKTLDQQLRNWLSLNSTP